MQLKIIQIALGWRGEKYSLKVSDRMRSKLCDTVRHMHEWEEAFRHVRVVFFFWFQGPWQLHSFMSWFPWLEGNPSPFFFLSCFSGHWHAARQYVASQCELSWPAGWQREAAHTNWLLPGSRSQTLHLRHVCWLLSAAPPLHLYSKSSKNPTSIQTLLRARRMRQPLRHGNLSLAKEGKVGSRQCKEVSCSWKCATIKQKEKICLYGYKWMLKVKDQKGLHTTTMVTNKNNIISRQKDV